jgi:predicted CXXCH cytochrome family protein
MLTLNLTELLIKKYPVTISILILSTFLSLADSHGREINEQSLGSCLFSEQLKGPYNKSEYLERLTYLKSGVQAGQNDVESMYQDIAKADYPAMHSNGLDPISYECLNCHDGSTAPLTGNSHPVGVDYPIYSMYGSNFVSRGALDRRIILIDGKVGCLSCHNPLNPARDHLVMSNDRSRLCLACHRD